MKYILVQKGDVGDYGHPFVDVTVIGPNGKYRSVRAMLDTGAFGSAVHHRVTKDLNFEKSGKKMDSYTFNGERKEKWYRNALLEFGGWSDDKHWLLVVPEFMTIKSAGFKKGDAMLGMDIIQRGKLEIKGSEFRFYLRKEDLRLSPNRYERV